MFEYSVYTPGVIIGMGTGQGLTVLDVELDGWAGIGQGLPVLCVDSDGWALGRDYLSSV
jgi:hypothetical protein